MNIQEPGPPERPLILLVDDLSANLHVLVAGLKSAFRIKTATSGTQALALLARQIDLPKLIVLDVKMPVMSGIEMLRKLREDPRTADIPVILISADASEQNEIAGLNLGADDYLVKPVSPSVLTVRANNLIQRNADRVQLRLAAHVFEYSGEAIMITDSENRIVDVNAAFSHLTGYDKAEVLGLDPRFLSAGRTTPEEFQAIAAALRDEGFWQGEIWDRRKDGGSYPKMMTISVVRNRAGDIDYYLANFIDISQFKDAEQRIEHLAHHDVLTGLPAERLELELTETAVTAHPAEAARLLQDLRELGVNIALDDFGQGYSSLGQLKDLPLDRLKIDAAFVWDISDQPGHKGGAIAAATIGLGHTLGFKVVAEGVETELQLTFLKAQGCDDVQGYYFGKPMPQAEFEAFLRERSP